MRTMKQANLYTPLTSGAASNSDLSDTGSVLSHALSAGVTRPPLSPIILGESGKSQTVADMLSDRHGHFDLDLVEHVTGFSPELVLSAYEHGQFPMAEDRHATALTWIEPGERGIIKVPQFKLPKRLARTVKNTPFRITCNLAFDAVVESCGAEALGRPDTWINDQIRVLYGALHRLGFAHSVEVWDDTNLVGGLYGLSLHGAFFGESMFSVRRDASKIALVHLVARMARSGMRLLDCQFYTRHLGQFGAVEITADAYLECLEQTQDDGTWFEGHLTNAELLKFIAKHTKQPSA